MSGAQALRVTQGPTQPLRGGVVPGRDFQGRALRHIPCFGAPPKDMLNSRESEVWLVGGGIASMASAVFLIRDAAMPAKKIHILEELAIVGGCLDGGSAPTQAGFVTRGG